MSTDANLFIYFSLYIVILLHFHRSVSNIAPCIYLVQDKLIRFAACFYLQLAEYREAILDFLAVLQGAGEGYLIGVFQVGTEG